jgi:hypothetical protein
MAEPRGNLNAIMRRSKTAAMSRSAQPATEASAAQKE